MQPPLEYIDLPYLPDKPSYVPGDVLHYSPTLRVGRGGRIQGLRQILNVNTHLVARLCSGGATKKYFIDGTLDRGIYHNIVTGAKDVLIDIENIPGGDYKVATNVNGFGDQAGEVGSDVYFHVDNVCS